MRERDKKSHTHLEGRIITWKNDGLDGGRIFFSRVVGCDYHIGLTIVDATTPERNLTCFNGPLSKSGREKFNGIPGYQESYDKKFEYALKVIRSNGLYDTQVKRVLVGQTGSAGYMNSCSFK